MEPSYSGGMNSDPMVKTTGRVNGTSAKFRISAAQRHRSASRRIGSYRRLQSQVSGFRDAFVRRGPRMRMVIRTGTSVIDNAEAKTMMKVLVKASGLNMRPSCASSKKTGTKEMTMMASEKKIGRPTCLAASRTICRCCSARVPS